MAYKIFILEEDEEVIDDELSQEMEDYYEYLEYLNDFDY
jgi:hypothetical protein